MLLRFRHIDQSAPYVEVEMNRTDDRFEAVVPGDYSDSPFALQYHFVVRAADGTASLYPGIRRMLSDQPYFLVRQKGAFDGEQGGDSADLPSGRRPG